MNYGRFFEFDFESSRLQEGIAVFNYRWLRDVAGPDRTDTPHHPVYLTFTSEAVVFNLHYLDVDLDNKRHNKDIHYHNPIIELTLSPNLEITDGLTESLNETYYSEFPIKANDPLRKIIRESYERERENDSLTFQDNYTSLEVFQGETEADYLETDNVEKKTATHFLRKLILDFLYDFEFTSVFKNLAYYNEVSVKLKENFLFNALMNKTRYYYYRTRLIGSELFSVLDDDQKHPDNERLDKNLRFLFQRYEKAEHEWVESIINRKSMEAFHESPWFEECHEELEQVFAVQRLQHLQKQNGNKIRSFQKKETKEIEPVREIENVAPAPQKKRNPRMRFLGKAGITPTNTFHLTVSNLLNLIHKKPSEETKQLEKEEHNAFKKAVVSHYDSARKAAKWDVEHFQFTSLFRIWCGDRKTLLLTFLSLAGLIILLTGLFFALHRKNGILYQNGLDIGWQVIIIAGTGLVLLCVLGVILRQFRRSTWGIGFPLMVMPRLLAAMVASWFTLCLSEDLFLKLSSIPFSISAVTILALITGFFIAYESYALNPYDNIKHYFLSVIWVFAIAYGYAIVTGLLVYDFFGERFIQVYQDELKIQGNDIIRQSLEDLDIDLYCHGKKLKAWSPNKHVFITQFSFFATFIGIFLQLMFQGKHIIKSE